MTFEPESVAWQIKNLGIEEGIEIGEPRGEARGEARGKALGEAKARKAIALGLLEAGVAIETIMKTTGLSVEELEALQGGTVS